MVGFYANRTITTEKRYVPAFFQRGKKVLTPVHGYGYCTTGSKDYAETTKIIYMPYLNVSDMFKVGQRVGVVVNNINPQGAELANHWSDGTITVVNPYGEIRVLLDNPIDIAYSGETEISFLDDQEVDVSHAHLWQTADGYSYITAYDENITHPTSAVVYNPATVLNQSLLLACTLDRYLFGTGGESDKWFVIGTDTQQDLTGDYSQVVAEEFVTYTAAQGKDSKYADAVAPFFWDRIAPCDGSIIKIASQAKKTWFKDRSFLFRIRGEAVTVEQVTSYHPASVVYVCNPFNITNNHATLSASPFVVAVPGTVQMNTANPIQLPVDTNLWGDGRINGGAVMFNDFRCAIADDGMPYIENIGNDANCEPGVDTSGDEIYCVYKTTDMVQEKFKNCTFDVFLKTPTSDNDMYIGGQVSNDRFTCDVYWTGLTIDEVFSYMGGDGATGTIEKATYPIMLSKTNIIESPAPDAFTQSVGNWDDCEYFNNRFWFGSGTMLKSTNALLEYDPVDTIPVPSAIIGLKALANMLFIMTSGGIYTINLKDELEMLSTIVPRMWSSVDESLYIVDENGQIHNTEFTPVPVRDQRKNTENPYMVLAQNTKMISDIADQWTVYDITNGHGMLWAATNQGLWTMNSDTKAWFKVSNDVFIKLITIGNEVYGISGRITPEKERLGIDVTPLQNLDKGAIS